MELNSGDPLTLGTFVCAHHSRFVREVKTRQSDGVVRRRWECHDCGERWTTFGPDKRKPKPRRKSGKPRPALSPQQVKRALTERHLSDVKLAAELGVSRQAVQQIRAGKTWQHAFPKLPRRALWRDCTECRHWSNESCNMGFPDPIEEGTRFAGDCDLYEV